MATVGEQLRAGRETARLSVHQIADRLKMRPDQVRALEAGNYDMFVAAVYVRGFVRGCATLLKLNVPEVMAALDAELAQTEKFREPPSLTHEPAGLLDVLLLRLALIKWRIVLPVLGVVVIVLAAWWGVRAYENYLTRNPLEGVGPGLYQPPPKPSGETLPLPAPPPAKK
jgi:cytoskeleton protein RodZ